MGMAEKRAMQDAQEKWLPTRTKEIADICGAEIPYEVDWDSFADDAQGISWLEANGPHQVACAFRPICKDDIGKEAIVEGIKKIVLQNTAEPGDKGLSLEGGVLKLVCAFAKSPGGRFAYKDMQKFLEEKL